MKTYLTPLEGVPSERRNREDKRDVADRRRPDWRFSVLADFEELMRSYGQDHVSLPY